MQPFDADWSRARWRPQPQPLRIGTASYQARLEGDPPYVEEIAPDSTRKLSIAYVLGGKNTYYLLTPMDRGRLQVLPLAFDVRTRTWYDMAASGARIHGPAAGAPLAWTDSAFTFNTSCYGCHVSQMQSNYDSAGDSYRSAWREAGIDCETCHGDATEHVKLMQGGGAKAADPRILRISHLNPTQRTDMCAPCHAKMSPLSERYQPAQRFFDQYDLTSLESPDFYPDGRDLGENYTFTGWLLGACHRGGKLDCLYCHTSTGAFRFAANSDLACAGCHQDTAASGARHTHHKADSAGARCTGCHMPKTRFANMTRSDHSFLPPVPDATRQFQSPNACNVCHTGKDAAWAGALVRLWYGPAYQKPVLERAQWIDDARNRRWSRAPAMIAYLREPDRNPAVAAALLRLLRAWDDPRKTPAFLESLRDESPLVRAAAAAGLAEAVAAGDVRSELKRAAADDYRLVRIRAAASLAPLPPEPAWQKAMGELEASFHARPDDYNAQTSLANFYLRRGDTARSVQTFEHAIRLRPDSVGTLVNASVAYSHAGRTADAERALRQAAQYAPNNPAVLFNLGLLLAELKRAGEAEATLRAAFTADPNLAPAAYNLAILVSAKDLKQAIDLCRKAAAISPEARYIKALAQFLAKDGQIAEAKRVFDLLPR